MSIVRLCLFTVLLACTVLSPKWVIAGEPSKFFPETGPEAIHQRMLDLGNGGVVLVVVLQPGYEDFPLLAYLRTALGARVGIAYMTNGEATPSDVGENDLDQVAGMRKEEAYRAMSMLDVTPRFLNLPDLGVVGSEHEVARFWRADTTLERLRAALMYFRPDVVVIGGDLQGDSVQSIRQRAVVERVHAALIAAGKLRKEELGKPNLLPLVGVRVFTQVGYRSPKGQRSRYDQLRPVAKRSYRGIGSEAATAYRSLRLQEDSWEIQGDRQYAALESRLRGDLFSAVASLPIVSAPLRPLATQMKQVAASAKQLREPEFARVVQAIDSVDHHLALGSSSLKGNDLRVLAGWKDGLEGLRCSMLNVKVPYAAEDSLVAINQVLYLKFGTMTSAVGTGNTRILFPAAMDHKWGVNESVEYQFPFNPPQQFMILTPRTLDYVYPPAEFGISETVLRTRFPFLVVHRDSTPRLSYLYRGDVRLRPAPKRTFEILTPIVRAATGQRVICRLTNVSRDPFEGDVTLSDSTVNLVRHHIALKGKDAVLLDTVVLSLRDTLPAGDYPLSLHIAGSVQGSFLMRSFPARIDTLARVGVVTAIQNSPLLSALDRLGIHATLVRKNVSGENRLSQYNVIILDRDALADAGVRGSVGPLLSGWVGSGGHLVVLPQIHGLAEDVAFPGMAFRRSPQLSPATSIKIDSTAELDRFPNLLPAADWEGWAVARAFCSVRIPMNSPSRVIVSSKDANVPLVVDYTVGKGTVTAVALDLISQLMNVHPGAHRLLANLVSVRE